MCLSLISILTLNNTVMKKYDSQKSCISHILAVLLLFFAPLSVFAQDVIQVNGVVTDDNNEPVIGASVMVKGSKIGVPTDLDGKYSISVAPDAVLEFSSIGYKTQYADVSGRAVINISLETDNTMLEQVVVVGYGTQKRQTLTGAISAIDGNEIVSTKNTSIAQSLQGKIAGVQIRQQDGQPGSFSSSIQIRGLGAPLYVIDGVLRDSGDGASEFQRLTADDIESVSVLKDGTAAIYGMNAANGVIIVTTKKGNKGKARFSYNGNVTAVMPTSMLEMMNAAEYVEVMNEYGINNGTGATTTPEELEKWRAGGPGYESTDWMDETFKKVAFSTQHTLSVSGGGKM